MSTASRVALVTGGARRLGQAIALALARDGFDVAISYHSSDRAAAETLSSLTGMGRRAVALPCDVRSPEQVRGLIEQATALLGPLDVAVVNAGIFRRTPLAEVTPSDWDEQLDTNVKGAFWCAQAVGLHMHTRGGAIILIADVAGLRAWANYIPYSATKAAVISMTQGLAAALAPTVRVNAVAPGPVLPPENFSAEDTRLATARTLLRRLGRPEDVAGAVVYLANADYVTGVVLPVDGGRHLG